MAVFKTGSRVKPAHSRELGSSRPREYIFVSGCRHRLEAVQHCGTEIKMPDGRFPRPGSGESQPSRGTESGRCPERGKCILVSGCGYGAAQDGSIRWLSECSYCECSYCGRKPERELQMPDGRFGRSGPVGHVMCPVVRTTQPSRPRGTPPGLHSSSPVPSPRPVQDLWGNYPAAYPFGEYVGSKG